LEIQSEKNERRFIKIIVGGLVGLIVAVVLVYASFNVFQRWEERHLIRMSAAYLSGGDVKAAALSARRALQMNPASADAARAMAQIADRSGDRGGAKSSFFSHIARRTVWPWSALPCV
jgi:Tfp pilus assembly protein PilF